MKTKKTILALVTATMMMLVSIPVFAAGVSCTVVSVQNKTVQLQCSGKNTLKTGDRVKVKASKATKQVEGC